MVAFTQSVKEEYPCMQCGVMTVDGVSSKADRSVVDGIVKKELERIRSMHEGYNRQAALATEPLCHYASYYKRWGKSYHVLGQLESILLKGKGIPPVGAPVEAMFLAEVGNLLLTAGHDFDLIEGKLTVDVAKEAIPYQGISGKETRLVENDVYLSDEKGVLSSILGGPDYRTRITSETKCALYFVYGVPGVKKALIQNHLRDISSFLSQAVQGMEIQSVDIL
jgi:DNA/RNA-binding domain of Phe-tRNA-synthetase-like protein